MIPPAKDIKQDPNAFTSTQLPRDGDWGQMTTSFGAPITDDIPPLTVGERGPILLQDFHLIDKLAHFDRERVPERVVHAKGAGAHGYFEVTKDVSHLTSAKFLSQVGKRTPMFARFSTVIPESGSADTVRNPRGFALKFYTEEGNFDMVGNNTPVFFDNVLASFVDIIHPQKRDPRTHMFNPDMFWDRFTLRPVSFHQLLIQFSNRGTPDGYRHMHGFSSHTYKLINSEGVPHYVKWHFRTDQGIKNLKAEEAVKWAGKDPDYATRDLFNAIERGDYPSWTLYFQVLTEEEAYNYKYDVFDVTKVISKKDFPLQEVGRFVLNRNPENYFAEVEQAAFAPAHMVPGIAPSPDPLLQGRLFSYTDAHLHRLGPNYNLLPINSPIKPANNTMRDGAMQFSDNYGRKTNYYPNSFGGPHPNRSIFEGEKDWFVSGKVGRYRKDASEKDYEQPRALYRLLDKTEQQDLVDNLAKDVSLTQPFIQKRVLEVLGRIDDEFRSRVEAFLRKENPDL
ncbi:catalase A [Coemansia sp. RSA 1821]|nr:catalase A [Coemansia sp. RSA 1086]KAJ1746971.1 catalase A [Coemansia sp. RSA 1821]KAJ2667851.1 catalase A [Coemansia sp. RSA 1085]